MYRLDGSDDMHRLDSGIDPLSSGEKPQLDGGAFPVHHDLHRVYRGKHRNEGVDQRGRGFYTGTSSETRKICHEYHHSSDGSGLLVRGAVPVSDGFPEDRYETEERIHGIPHVLCTAFHYHWINFVYHSGDHPGNHLCGRRCKECLSLV